MHTDIIRDRIADFRQIGQDTYGSTEKGKGEYRNAEPPNGNEKERAREVGRGRLNTRRDARAPSVWR